MSLFHDCLKDESKKYSGVFAIFMGFLIKGNLYKNSFCDAAIAKSPVMEHHPP
jgi:hypothetical protein